MRYRILVAALAALALLAVGVLFMLAFGAPQSSEPTATESAAVALESVPVVSDSGSAAGADEASAAAGTGSSAEGTVVPDPDPSSPLMVEIPGCVCHSDDPALVKEHEGYRMNQCFGCHTGGMPEMAR